MVRPNRWGMTAVQYLLQQYFSDALECLLPRGAATALLRRSSLHYVSKAAPMPHFPVHAIAPLLMPRIKTHSIHPVLILCNQYVIWPLAYHRDSNQKPLMASMYDLFNSLRVFPAIQEKKKANSALILLRFHFSISLCNW